jgi:hypothetical protein
VAEKKTTTTSPPAQPCGGMGGGGCYLYDPEDLLNKNRELHLNYYQKLIEIDVYNGNPLNKKVS